MLAGLNAKFDELIITIYFCKILRHINSTEDKGLVQNCLLRKLFFWVVHYI